MGKIFLHNFDIPLSFLKMDANFIIKSIPFQRF